MGNGNKKGGAPVLYNWPGAFLMFAAGDSLEKVAEHWGIPYDTLRGQVFAQRWHELAKRLPVVPVSNADALSVRVQLLEENRAKNYAMACKLRDHAVTLLDALSRGELRMKKQWHNRGVIIEQDVEPTTGDYVNIGTYVRTIAEISYAALGDQPARGADKHPEAPPPPSVTIILPGAVSQPRAERQVQGPVIDLRRAAITEEKSANAVETERLLEQHAASEHN